MATLLEIKGLKMSYGDNEVLKGVDLSVQAGEKVIIMGTSGSGKSTLLRCINHLEKTSCGTMIFAGRTIDLSAWKKKDVAFMRSNTSMVFQNYCLFEHMTVLQNVMEGLVQVQKKTRKEAQELALHYLELTNMIDKKDYYPSALSGGQQQRVGIARALSLKPKAILFDEPTSALDPELVGGILSLMKQVAKEGITMLVVTHEVAFAREVADTIVVMDNGVLIEKGTAEEILENPKHDRTKKFLNLIKH